MDHGGWTGVRVKERRRGPDGWIRVLQGLVILFSGALEHMFRPRLEALYLKLARNKAEA